MKRILFVAVLAAFNHFVYSQAGIEISVINGTTGLPVANYPIILTNQAIGFQMEKNTDSQGKARFRGLSTSGHYAIITPASEQYHAFEKNDLVFRSNQSSSITIVLNMKSALQLEGVVVQGGGFSQINTVNAEVTSELTSKEIETLPIEGRDITRALFRLPNVTQATGFFSEAPNVAINGANSLYTSYLIDGLDNNENFLGGQKFAIPVGFTQNITVLANNYSAEYGQTANGIFNITTKSGSNEVRGEAFYITRPGPVIDASSPFAQRDLSGNPVRDGFQRHQMGFGIGGPIVKDQTFYYVNMEYTKDLKDNLLNSPVLGVNETVRGENDFLYFSAKLDHTWSPSWKSSLRVNMGDVGIERQGGGLEGGMAFESAGNVQDRNSLQVASQNVYRRGNFLSETHLQFARFRWDFANPNNPSSPNVTVLDATTDETIAVLGHPGFIFNSLEETLELQQKFTLFKDKHTLKAGFGIISSDHSLLGGGNPNGSYTVALDETQAAQVRNLHAGAGLSAFDIPLDAEVRGYSIELRPQSFGARQNRWSVYVEDLWSVTNRLNVTLGIRYDYDNLSEGGSARGDFNNIAPRVNANYKIGERSNLRFGYGIFYEKILYAVYSDALQQNRVSQDYRRQLQALIDQGILPADTDLDKVTFEGNLGATFDRAGVQEAGITYLNGPGFSELQGQRETIFDGGDTRVLNPEGYDNPFSHQFMLGYQNQVNDNILFYVDLVHARSFNLFRLRNLNAPAPHPVVFDPGFTLSDVRTTQEADATRPVPVGPGSYALVAGDTLHGGARNIVVSETGGTSTYYAANFNLVKDRGDDNYAYRLYYTLSRLRNNTEDINFRASDANDFSRDEGPSVNDRTHVISAIGYFYPFKDLSVSLASLIQSGQPINRIPGIDALGTTDLNGDGQSFGDAFVGNSDRSPGESRNSDRLPWSTTFDVGLQYQFSFGGGSALELRADVFNLFNAENLSGYSNNATQSNQIQPGPASSGVLIIRNAAPPRQFQFGVRYLF